MMAFDLDYLQYMRLKRKAEIDHLVFVYTAKYPVGSEFTTYSGKEHIAFRWEVRGIVDQVFVCRNEFIPYSGEYSYKSFAVQEFAALEKDNRIIKGWHP